jgi:hypothetical protein
MYMTYGSIDLQHNANCKFETISDWGYHLFRTSLKMEHYMSLEWHRASQYSNACTLISITQIRDNKHRLRKGQIYIDTSSIERVCHGEAAFISGGARRPAGCQCMCPPLLSVPICQCQSIGLDYRCDWHRQERGLVMVKEFGGARFTELRVRTRLLGRVNDHHQTSSI